MTTLRQFASAAIAVALITVCPPCLAQDSAAIKVVVIEGEGAANIVANKIAIRPHVEVRDAGNVPIPDVKVTFVLPKVGARAAFRDGRETFSVLTSINGRARAAEMEPLGIGTFQITASAEHQGQSASAVITQTNYATVWDAQPGGPSPGADSASYKIQILEGDDGVNIINKKTAVKTLARVVDKNNLPVAAVPVVFAIVYTRKGGKSVFPDGKTTLTVTTNVDGKAEAPAVQPQGKGSFQIQIQATVNGTTVGRSIGQTNFPTEAAARSAGKTPGASARPEGAETSATESASANGGANGGGAGSGAGSAAGTGAAAAGGISGAQVAGLVSGGLLAAGGIARLAGLLDEKPSQKDCSSTFNSFLSSAQSTISCAQASRDPSTQCRSAAQQMVNGLGSVCSCAGGLANAPAEIRTLYSQLEGLVRQLGLTSPSSCR